MRRLSDALLALVGLGLAGFLLAVALPGLLGGAGTAPVRASAGDGEPAASPAAPAAPERGLRCGPCGMALPPDAERIEIAGRRWAVCSERCAEIIAADPDAWAADAVPAD